MGSLLLIQLLAVPIGILIGMGASIIGLTAWPLVVPLFFVFGGFSLHESLLASMCIDFVLASFLSLYYKERTSVDVATNYGFRLGLLSGATALIAAVIAFPILTLFSDSFKSGAGIVNLLLGSLILIQAVRTKNGSDSSTDTAQEISGSRFQKWQQSLTTRQKDIATSGFCALQGLITGLIAIGGAMNIVLVLIILQSYPTLRAVGTAMVSTMTMLLIVIVTYLFLLGFSVSIWPLILLYSSIAILTCVVSIRMAQRISERGLRFVIGAVVIAAAIFSMVQVYVLL